MFPSNQALSARPRRRRRRAARGMNRARSIQAIPSNQVARVGRNSGRRRRSNRDQLVELVPSAVINRSMSTKPSFSGRGGVVQVSHREYFQTLSSALTETFTSELINPCNSNLFPWLCMIAPSWERYRFKALTFSYKTSCSTTTAGDLALAIDYDARDPLPTSFGEFSSHEGCVTGNFYGNLNCPTIIKNFDKRNRGWYLTAEDVKSTELAEFYGGSFEVYTSVAAAAAPVGKLYVDYVIELNNPQPRDNDGLTTISLLDTKTVDSGNNLITNYVTQTGATQIVGDDLEVVANGLKFLRGGDYSITFNGDTDSDTSTALPALNSAAGVLSLIRHNHNTTDNSYTQIARAINVQAGDTIDWAVTVANFAITTLAFYFSRYKTSNY